MKRALSIFAISLLFSVDAGTKAKDIIDNAQGPQEGDQERKELIYSIIKKKLYGIPGPREQTRNALGFDPSLISTSISPKPSKDDPSHDISDLSWVPGNRDDRTVARDP